MGDGPLPDDRPSAGRLAESGLPLEDPSRLRFLCLVLLFEDEDDDDDDDDEDEDEDEDEEDDDDAAAVRNNSANLRFLVFTKSSGSAPLRALACVLAAVRERTRIREISRVARYASFHRALRHIQYLRSALQISSFSRWHAQCSAVQPSLRSASSRFACRR